jgi:mannose-6-phosphate isomerase-like protein (cupin superfamily)
MIRKDLKDCAEITAGDNSILKEILNPDKEDLQITYSLAYARVLAAKTTLSHKLKSSEVYYFIKGKGEMYINDEKEPVSGGQTVYVPPESVQKLKNTGSEDLVFLCIVDPAWKAGDEKVVED